MASPSVKHIESLSRGISVLLLLQEHGPMPLRQIHDLTKIPKASLLRILNTLISQGVIWQRMADDAYVASIKLLQDPNGRRPEARLLEIAAPIMRALSSKVKWPSVLAAPRLAHMEVIDTNAPHAEIEDVPLGPIGFQINILRSASGRAYLSYCSDAVLEATLSRLKSSNRLGDRLARNDDYIRKMITDTREKGFALRDPDFGGNYDAQRNEIDDKRNSIAVPIFDENQVVAALNITWTIRSMTIEQARNRFVPHLLHAANEISTSLKNAFH